MTEELDDMTPFERVMRSSKRPAKILDMPGYPGTRVAMLVPSDEEVQAAQVATLHHLTGGGLKLDEYKLAISLESDLFESELDRQKLVRVLRNPVDTNLPFATIESLRQGLSATSRKMLMRILDQWIDERSPETKQEDAPERTVDLVRGLKEDGALADYLTRCDFATLTGFVLSLAEVYLKPTNLPSSDSSSSNSPTS